MLQQSRALGELDGERWPLGKEVETPGLVLEEEAMEEEEGMVERSDVSIPLRLFAGPSSPPTGFGVLTTSLLSFAGQPSFYTVGGDFGASLAPVNWAGQQLVPVPKDFYDEAPEVAALSEAEVAAIRQEKGITIVRCTKAQGTSPVTSGFKPVQGFGQTGLPDYVSDSSP